MSAIRGKSSVRDDHMRRVWVDLLIAPLSLLLALLLSALVPTHAMAQTPPTLTPWGGLDTLVARMVYARNQELAARSASAAGVTIAQSGAATVVDGTTVLGKVAVNELRVVPLARIAARAAAITAPIAIAMIAGDLISYGIQQCSTSGTGWCGQAAPPGPLDQGKTWTWNYGAKNGTAVDAQTACNDLLAAIQSGGGMAGATTVAVSNSNGAANCVIYYSANQASWNIWNTIGLGITTTCRAGYVLTNGSCVSTTPVAYTYPQLSDKLAQALSGNPNRAKDYWGIMSPADWYAELGQPTTQALPAEVPSAPGNSITGPRKSVLGPSGQTTTMTTYTVSPNTDAGTLATNPVVVTQTDVTTNPDGSTTTTTTTTTPVATGGGAPADKPPTPCGLGTAGSPNCKIDETGTPSKTDATTAMASPATDLQTAEQTAEQKLTDVTKGLSWTLTMPHILPGGTCVPIEWFSWGSWRASWDVCGQLYYVRDLLAWLWPVLAAVYVWNRAAGANAGVV